MRARKSLALGLTAVLAASTGSIVAASSAQAYGPAAGSLNCTLYFGDSGTGSSESVYDDTFALTQTPAYAPVGSKVTVTFAGAQGLRGGPVASAAGSNIMRATLQLSGAQSGTVVASTTPGTYPAAEVPGAPNPNPNRLGKFVATGSYTVTKAGTTTATLKLLKVDNQTEFNVDTYCAAGITGDIKAAGGALSPTIRQANINGPKPVVKDVTKPVVSIKALNSKAKKVKKVTGTISDSQSGPKSVTVSLIQKRGSKTFAYNGKKWVSGPTAKKAIKKAKKITVASSGAWSVTVKKVKKGKITVTYFGTDKAGNVSAPKKYSKALK